MRLWKMTAATSISKHHTMADVQVKPENNRRKTAAPRVDLTPMVDLGFILITFFIYTTTMAQNKAMEIQMPYKPADPSTVFIDTSTITLIPTADHKIVYYQGKLRDKQQPQVISYSELRSMIPQKQSDLKHLSAKYSDQARMLQVIVKPHDSCSYEDFVAIMDEMKIHQVPIYTVADLTEEEQTIVATKL